MNIWGIASIAARACGDHQAARVATTMAVCSYAKERHPIVDSLALHLQYQYLDLRGDSPRRALQLARQMVRQSGGWNRAFNLCCLAEAGLVAGHSAAALRATEQSTRLQLARRGRSGGGMGSGVVLWWTPSCAARQRQGRCRTRGLSHRLCAAGAGRTSAQRRGPAPQLPAKLEQRTRPCAANLDRGSAQGWTSASASPRTCTA